MATDRKTTSVMLIAIAALVGYIAYSGTGISSLGLSGLKQQKAHIAAIKDTVTQLEAQTDSAKQVLARGTMDDLRRRIDESRASLGLLRRLVPEQNEVPNLLDDMSTRAKIRGVELAEVTPQLPLEHGPAPFDTHRYNIRVLGHYDRIGEFLADIASLQRIVVPSNLVLAGADANAAKALGDSSGAMLQASFQIRTYVKSSAPPEEGGNGDT